VRGITAAIEIEIGAFQVQPTLFCSLLQRVQALWSQHRVGLSDGRHGARR
jgi:hypothetical protein